MQHALAFPILLAFALTPIQPARANTDNPTPIAEFAWEATQSGLLVRMYTDCPEVEAWIVLVRYRLAGEMIVREHRRAVLRNMEPRTTTDFFVPTSGPAYVVEARWRKVAIMADGEAVAQW